MKPIPPQQLDRLVDGELSRDQIKDLLQRPETDPAWRSIALAFVEDRVWRTEIQASVEPHDQYPVPTQTILEPSNVSATVDPKRKSVWKGMALAAGLMVALGVGYLTGSSLSQSTTDSGLALSPPIAPSETHSSTDQTIPDRANPANQLANNQRPDITPTALSTTPDYHLGFQDSDGNPLLNSDIPLYATKDMQANVPAFDRIPISDEVIHSLHGSGYAFKENTRYVAGRLDDGRQFVVPIRTTNLSAGQ